MGRYSSHEDFGADAPVKYREDSTSVAYLKGMAVITPPGMKPRASRAAEFEARTDFKASALWHRNFDVAMFGGSDIGSADFESRQLGLEARRESIKRSGEQK
jgi:hypothetical protein